MPEQITVKPLSLQELTIPLLLDEFDSDWTCDPGDWPPCWLPVWSYTDDQRTIITDGTYSDPYKVRSIYLSDIIEAFRAEYGGLTGIGKPIAYDPTRRAFLFGRNGTPRAVRSTEVVEAFFGVELSHAPVTTEQDRVRIDSFVSRYGLFVPFASIEMTTDAGALADAVAATDNHAVYVDGQTVRFPYRNMDPQSTPDALRFQPAEFRGRMLYYYEMFACWHEAALTVRGMSTNESDYTGQRKPQMEWDRQAMTNLWKSCVSPNMTLSGGVARVEDRPRLRIYEPLVDSTMLYPCAIVAFYLKDELDNRFEEDTRDLLIDRVVPCMTPGCNGVCHTARSEIYGWAEDVGENWAYCTDCQSGNGRKALRGIAKRHPEHAELQAWWEDIKRKDKARKTFSAGRTL
jgi:hypothetical protein